MDQAPETHLFADDGHGFPNSALPLLVYRGALPPDSDAMERAFAANGWSNAWRDGIFRYHHFHSTAHEVLGIAAGEVRVAFGGPSGREVTIRAGDGVAIPAGVAHRNLGQSADLLVVGAYPGGADYDIRRGEPAEHAAAARAIAAVPLPGSDPVLGRGGHLRRLWAGAAGLQDRRREAAGEARRRCRSADRAGEHASPWPALQSRPSMTASKRRSGAARLATHPSRG